MKRVLFAVVIASASVACSGATRVTRVYDGRVVEGRYVAPEAYAAFLRGVLAEESGDLAGARRAYEEVLDEDSDDPLAWARVGEVACKQGGAEGHEKARRAFAKALELDPTYAGALAAEARCALASGDVAGADAAAKKAVAADPKDPELAALALRAEAKRPATPEARARALALTQAHGEREAAWDALLAWGRGHGDDELVARGLAGLGPLSPLRVREVEAGARDLAARDHVALARTVAAALADAPRDQGHTGPHDAVVARLAVDEAILRGDATAARYRAARGHVPLSEVAARAFVHKQRALAAELAHELASADPGASAPAMVLAALALEAKPRDKSAPSALPKPTDAPPALCAFVLADRIAATSSADAARAWLAQVRYVPAPAHDPVAAALAAELSGLGVISPEPSPKADHASDRAAPSRRAALGRVSFEG